MSLMAVNGIQVPADDVRIWRYMGFSKFVAMVSSGTLYFRRIDQFEDRLEGVLPDAAQANYGPSLNQMFKDNVERLFANCWHMNTVESVLMWKSYSSGEPAVAIESTVGAVKSVLDPLSDAYVIGKVSYIDFKTQPFKGVKPDVVNIVVQAYHKRMFFEAEQEFRIVPNPLGKPALAGKSAGTTGFPIPLDLNRLIHQIRIAGDAHWLIDAINAVMGRFGLNKPVVPSDI